MLDVYDYSKAAANLRLKLADQENETLKEQLQALAAQNKAMREALEDATSFVDMHSEPWYKSGQKLLDQCRAALTLPDLATPILNKVRAETIRTAINNENVINRMIAAIEGECNGLAIDSGHAKAILDYVLADAIEKGE